MLKNEPAVVSSSDLSFSSSSLIPLTVAQRGLWFSHYLNPDAKPCVYKVAECVELDGAIDTVLFADAVRAVVAETEVLCLMMVPTDDGPAQYFADQPPDAFRHIDVSREPNPREAAMAWMQADINGPFPLAKGPFFSHALLKLGDEQWVFYHCYHHMVMDGLGASLIMRRLAERYSALVEGRVPSDAGFSSVQQVLAAEQDYAASARAQQDREYWVAQLEGHPAPVSLAGRLAPCLDVVREQQYVSDATNRMLRALAEQEGKTLPQVLSTLVVGYVYGMTQQEDLLLGMPVMARNGKVMRQFPGMASNGVPLRLAINGEGSFADNLACVTQGMYGVMRHQRYRTEDIRAAMGMRGVGDPLYLTLVNIHPFQYDDIRFGDVPAKVLNLALGPVDDLLITLMDRGEDGGIEICLSANALVHDSDSLRWHLRRLNYLLEKAAQHWHTPLSHCDMQLPEERASVLAWGKARATHPQVECLHTLFEAQAAKHPDAVAVSCGDQRRRYGELNAQANRLAHALMALGVRPDSRVAIALERGVELPLAILAVLKAGGGYVPLDPHYPQQRLRYILDDSAPDVLMTTREVLPTLGVLDDALPVLLLDDDAWQQQSADNIAPDALGLTPSHLAYIIYTSGSTGQPKGVMVEHRNVTRLLAATATCFDVSRHDVWTLFHSYAFDFSVWELWGALAYGGRLVVVPTLTARSPDAFYQLLCDEQVTVLNQTPSAFRQLVAALPEGEMQHALKWIVFGGEALDVSALTPWYARNGERTQLINMYGITETTVHVTFHPLSPSDAEHQGNSPIGKPLDDLSLYLLDERGMPVPVGVTGELYVGGAGVARGYLNRPELTAERFLPDPFGADPSARMYRTGDIGRWTADGTLDYLGRNDQQVKIRGFRIELGEIAARLREHAAVRDAVVTARADSQGHKALVAYLVPLADMPESADLRGHLAAVLPEYMLPAAFVSIDALPLTANGKLDERALPEPDATAVAQQDYEAPCGATETVLAELWQALLGVERVGRHDDFFALGGHSLLAVQLASRVRTVLNVVLPLGVLFDTPVLCALASVLDTQQQATLPPVVAQHSDRAPLSLAQQRLWLLSRISKNATAAYVIAGELTLRGELHQAALAQALDTLVDRHEALRTVLIDEGDQPVQCIDSTRHRFPLTRLDADSVPEFSPTFDLNGGSLVQGRLVRLSAQHHVLQLAFHHIIMDGWSVGILLRELGELYRAAVNGSEAMLPPLHLRYLDYALWQRQYIDGAWLDDQRQYWASQLAQAPDCLTLPTDYPRPEVQSFSGGHAAFVLDDALVTALEALARRHGCTLFMTLLASWSVLMSRLSGQTDVVTGTPIAGRSQQELEPLIGMFVNTLALRVTLDDAPNTPALLAQVRATTLAAQQHADVMFEQVVDIAAPVRSTAHSPLFQTLLALHNVPESVLTMPGLDVALSPSAQIAAHFDLSIELTPCEHRLDGVVHYASALFSHDTVTRWLGYWRCLLEGMVAQPERSVMALPLMDDGERQQLLTQMNGEATALPSTPSLHTLFEVQAQRCPEAVAVVTASERYSYAALNQNANRLAHWLIEQGVGPDSRVAVIVERGPQLIVALLAVLKAGGAYVPFDPAYPQARLQFMLDDCAPMAIITAAAQQALIGEVPVPLAVIDSPSQLWSAHSDHNPVVRSLMPHHLAYVVYTSGSTGQPKGVMVEHRHVINLVHWHNQTFELSAGKRVSCVAGIGFDAAVWEIWPALSAGAQLWMPSPDEARDPERLLAWWQSQPLEVSFLPTPIAELAFARHLHHDTLRTLLVGGEKLNRRAPDDAPFTLVNSYGPTENAVVATSGLISDADDVLHIGRPITNTRVYVLDDHQQPVPVGVAGELYLGGAQVARGYLHQPELTAERFLPDPFVNAAGGNNGDSARMYRTGDLVRWRTDGTLEYLGRNDFQVKIRGFRIELGEIEAALLRCQGIEEAVVVANEQGEATRLVAYITLPEGGDWTPDTLRHALAERLPDYMVPAAYVVLASLPLTPNGKVDRRALPAPADTAFPHREYEAPQGELEQQLAAQWCALLGVERVGRHDDFFALGGHSLLAVQLISRIRDELQYDVALSVLFAHSTLSALADQLSSTARVVLPPILPLATGQEAPLSLAQQRLWFLAQMDDGANAAYVISGGLCLTGTLNVEALQQALNSIVARQAALRTHIERRDSGPVQVVASASCGFPLECIEATDPAAVAPFMPVFDLTQGPLAQGQLVCFAEDHHWLRLALHHVIADGWSISLLVKELSALYNAFVAGQLDPLPPLSVQYIDYAAWQQCHLGRDALLEQQRYWVTQLRDVPDHLQLPTDHPRPARQCYDGHHVSFSIDTPLLARVKQLSQQQGCTLFMTLMASWSVLMGRLSGQQDIVIGTPVAARHHRDIEPLIGMFVNTLALRVDLSDAPDTPAVLAQMKATALAAQQHADVPFEQVVEAVAPRRSLAHSPLFQVMLALHNLPEATPTLSGVTASPLPNDIVTSQFDLNLELQEVNGQLHGTLYYATALFEHETVSRWAEYWVTVLEGMVRYPQRAVTALPLLESAESHHRAIKGEQAAPVDTTLHALFEAQVASCPNATAVIDEQGSLTYGVLEARANQLAHALLARGITIGDRVGLCVERSRAMAIGGLGILKAGAAYVPLDTRYPRERLAVMQADSGVAVVVADAVGAALLSDDVPVLRLDSDALDKQASIPPSSVAVSPEALAYVIYTSGSTGQPKGIAMPHAPLVNLIRWQNRTPAAVTSQFAAFGFDVASQELLSALLSGGTLAIVPDRVRLDMPRLMAFFDDHKVERAFLPPALLNALAHAARDAEWTPSLREVVCSGEALRINDDIRALFARAPHLLLHNQYGPAETHVVCAAHSTPDAAHWPEFPPIGRPLPGVTLYVLDATGQPVPPSVSGELYIGGQSLSRGYLGVAEQNAERFLPDPFNNDVTDDKEGQVARMYRTGDVVRQRSDGQLEYLGRCDHQITLRGYRIEPGDIETLLRRHLGVSDALVMLKTVGEGEPLLVAYLIGSVDLTALRAYAGAHLPDYMVPSAWVVMDEFPLTPNGKVDRRALPAPNRQETTVAFEPPADEEEQSMAALWARLLGVERVGRHDDFFALGGHSLLAMRIITEVQHTQQVDVSVSELFEHSTLAAFTERVMDISIEQFDLDALLSMTDEEADDEAL